MASRSVQYRPGGRRCPCFGVFCFLCAFIASLVGAKSASADTPLPAIKVTPIAAPAAVLGIMNPYVVAAAAGKPRAHRFILSQDLRMLVDRVEHLARYGVDLNQRKLPRTEKLQLRVVTRGIGGVVQLRYKH